MIPTPVPLPHPGLRWLALTLAAALGAAGAALAQDPVFSQYTAAAVYNNPALAGLYDGDVRLAANYREQWSSSLGGQPLRTYAAGAELRYDLGGRDYFAASTNLLHDSGGEAEFARTQASVALTGQKYLAGGRGRDATYLGFGARVGYGQHRIKPTGLWFSSQYDTASASVGGEAGSFPASFTGSTRGYLDAAVGVSLTVVKERYSVWGGVAGHHLTQPNVSFLGNAEIALDARYTAIVGGEWLYTEELRLLPSLIAEIQGPHRRVAAGAAVYYKPENRDGGDTGFRMGVYARTAAQSEGSDNLESVIFAAQIEFGELAIGISYDINVDPLALATDGRGAYELSVGYVLDNQRRHKVVCPKI